MKKRNAEETKELILSTAIKEFAKYGYDGVRMDRLAKVAGISKAVIYYHFEDKKAVFEKILFDMTQFIQHKVLHFQAEKNEPSEKLEAFLDAIIEVVSEKREIAQILMKELSYYGVNISDEIKEQFYMVLKTLIKILHEGIEKGVFNKVDPLLIHSITVGGLNYFYGMREIAIDKGVEEIGFADVKDVKKLVLNYVVK